ncbi:MAG: hypothetical protein IKB28_04080 [Clostridia bacterium]|nr:hypothetical protein [Clostridia bacterium]
MHRRRAIRFDSRSAKQSKQDIKRDYCNLVIKNTVFGFYGVRRCNALREYIKQNYK